MYLKLVRPTCEYAEQVMQYKEDMLANNDSFDGCAGLEEVDSFTEWIDFENRLKRKYGEGYVPSEVFLGVRIEDDKVVGIIDYRHPLSPFLLQYGGNIGYSILPSERRKGYAGERQKRIYSSYKKKSLRHRKACSEQNWYGWQLQFFLHLYIWR